MENREEPSPHLDVFFLTSNQRYARTGTRQLSRTVRTMVRLHELISDRLHRSGTIVGTCRDRTIHSKNRVLLGQIQAQQDLRVRKPMTAETEEDVVPLREEGIVVRQEGDSLRARRWPTW